MTDLAIILKNEIRRIAKKESKNALVHAHRQIAQHRHDIAKLKKIIHEQFKRISRLEALEQKQVREDKPSQNLPEGIRFSSRSVKAQRTRLNLSAELYGKLLGVSAQTIYDWERKRSRPRKQQMASWLESRSLSRKQALARLEMLGVVEQSTEKRIPHAANTDAVERVAS